MAHDTVTRYNVDALVAARKVASSPKLNTMSASGALLNERCLKVDIRRIDSPSVGISLEFYGRVMIRELAGVRTTQRPSAALIWHGKRIRGLDHSLKHDVVENGLITGSIKGWHEHFWTDSDEDRRIRDANDSLQKQDLQSVISWCCKHWKIEGMTEQTGLFS
jgi:hypothetical protein